MRKPLTLTLLLGTLASCTSLQNVRLDGAQAAKYALTINLTPSDTPSVLEQRYSGTVEVWRADDGFAILSVNRLPTNDPAVRGSDENAGPVTSPELQVGAASPSVAPQAVQTGGWTAWSGGWTAWSGSWTAWSGGTGSSVGPTQNTAVWNKIGLPTAQSRATKLGNGVRIAVIDTGVDLNHPALKTRLVSSADMYDFVDNDSNPQEVGTSGTDAAFGHGTGVAGIIAQIAPNAKIMPLRALSPNGSGTETGVANAINWAINHNAQIIQLSLGSMTDSTTLGMMIASATNKGIYVVTSVGNENSTQATYPALYNFVSFNNCNCAQFLVGVGSVDGSDVKSIFSNYMLGVTMVAPGERIYTPYPGNRLGYWSGTSFAAPMVAGSIGLAMGQQPTTDWAKGNLAKEVAFGADDVSAVNGVNGTFLGAGRLDIPKFLRRIGL